MRQLFLLLALAGGGYAQTLTQQPISLSRAFETGMVAVPHAALTDLSTATLWVDQIIVANTTAGALTITIQDKQSTPRALFTTVSIAANSTYVVNLVTSDRDGGLKFTSGISWRASGAGLVGSVRGKKQATP